MWGVLNFGLRLTSRYLLPRRWTRYALVAGVVLLSIFTALLIDAKLYLTAAIAGLFAVICLILSAVQFFQASREKAERLRQRAAAAQARAEKIENVRTALGEVASGLGSGAASLANATKGSAVGLADVTKKGIAGARDRWGSWRKKEDRVE
ncbi:MAG TPA: hypothetical protein VJL90_02455 [Pseudorhodoplanes sp.]|nr:hypothetical protein [Pseudorhodoplanes sp.]